MVSKCVVAMVAVMVTLAVQVLGVENGSLPEDALRDALLKNYNKNSFPSTPMNIDVTKFSVLGVVMHGQINMVDLHAWFGFVWNDQRLQWDPAQHSNIDRLGVDSSTVWKPDLTMYTIGSQDQKHLMESDEQVVVDSLGKVIFVPPMFIRVPCVLDMTYWPHDIHNCKIKIGSWVNHAGLVDLNTDNFVYSSEMETVEDANGNNMTTTQWQITDVTPERISKKYDCCLENYVHLQVSFKLKRDAPAYCWTVKAPVVCLSILTVVLFLLPPKAGEKLVFGGLCLILDLLFIAYTSNIVSYAPSRAPLIIQLVSQQLILTVVSVILAALVVRLARGPHPSPLPSFLKTLIMKLSTVLCLSGYAKLVTESEQDMSSKRNEVEMAEGGGERRSDDAHNVNKNQWLLLAAMLDRLLLFIFLLACIVLLSRFSSIL
ncbi:neuronal acetylcholine receptor subunit alpha-6-like [Homarus americanus]|nr:neuronal acetylcholine receptor subunit alpha-6-like [Homarus americanus]